MLDDDDHILSTKLLEYNKQSSSLDEAPSSTLSAEADPLVTLTNYDFEQNGNWGEGENLGESLENLKINGNDGFQNSEISDSSFGGTENVSMDTYSASQWVPGAMNPMLSSGFTNDRLCELHTILPFLGASFLTRAQCERIPFSRLPSLPAPRLPSHLCASQATCPKVALNIHGLMLTPPASPLLSNTVMIPTAHGRPFLPHHP